jgi:hypothetical protein
MYPFEPLRSEAIYGLCMSRMRADLKEDLYALEKWARLNRKAKSEQCKSAQKRPSARRFAYPPFKKF